MSWASDYQHVLRWRFSPHRLPPAATPHTIRQVGWKKKKKRAYRRHLRAAKGIIAQEKRTVKTPCTLRWARRQEGANLHAGAGNVTRVKSGSTDLTRGHGREGRAGESGDISMNRERTKQRPLCRTPRRKKATHRRAFMLSPHRAGGMTAAAGGVNIGLHLWCARGYAAPRRCTTPTTPAPRLPHPTLPLPPHTSTPGYPPRLSRPASTPHRAKPSHSISPSDRRAQDARKRQKNTARYTGCSTAAHTAPP